MELVGTDAVLQVPAPFKPGATGEMRLWRGFESTAIESPGGVLYEGELDDMARQILDDAAPTVPLHESRRLVKTLATILESARQEKTIGVA
jgi:hypothetical protein